jgi:hypothetical protein
VDRDANCVHLVWIEVQVESRNCVPSLIPQCCADTAGTCQVVMTQLRQHLGHDVIWQTLQAAAAGRTGESDEDKKKSTGVLHTD